MFPDTREEHRIKKIILTPSVHVTLTMISFLCTIHSVASSLEINPMCSNWDEVSFMTKNIPFFSDSSYTGNVLLDIVVWILFIFYFFVLRVTFVWPLITFIFFLVSYRVSIHGNPKGGQSVKIQLRRICTNTRSWRCNPLYRLSPRVLFFH